MFSQNGVYMEYEIVHMPTNGLCALHTRKFAILDCLVLNLVLNCIHVIGHFTDKSFLKDLSLKLPIMCRVGHSITTHYVPLRLS